MRSRAGFTLLELTCALAVFLVVGLALKDTVLMADRSQDAVMGSADDTRQLREASRRLADDLGGTQEAQLTLAPLGDGSSQATFPTPIGDDAWGVEEPGVAGGAPQEQPRARTSSVERARREARRGRSPAAPRSDRSRVFRFTSSPHLPSSEFG